jgi:integrase
VITKIGLYKDPRKQRPWVVRWFGEYDPATGKQKRYSKSFAVKRDADSFQAQQLTEFKQGQRRDKPDEITLKEFCRNWLECLRAGPETVKLYKNTIRRLLTYFGENTLLRQVTPLAADRFMASLKPLDSRTELSSSARHRVLRHCRTMFKKAVDWELISKNPFSSVSAPKIVTKQWHYLKPVEYRRLLKATPSLRWRAFYALCYTGALRLGEALSALWTDLDLENRQIKVQGRPATAVMPPFEVKDKESRVVDLPEETIHILEDLATYYEATETKSPYIILDKGQWERVKVKWQTYRQQGKPWRNKDLLNNALTNFKRHLKKAGIKQDEGRTLSVHCLRKGCIQNWANNITNPEVVRVLAGHSDLKTTMQYYCQVDREQRAKAAAAIDNLLRQTDAGVTPEATFGENSGNRVL